MREAFPKDYEGLYSEEEMIASGAIPASYTVVPETGEVIEDGEDDDPAISQEQRQALFRMAKEHLGSNANEALKEMVKKQGYDSTIGMPLSAYNKVLGEIIKAAELGSENNEVAPESGQEDGQEEPAE